MTVAAMELASAVELPTVEAATPSSLAAAAVAVEGQSNLTVEFLEANPVVAGAGPYFGAGATHRRALSRLGSTGGPGGRGWRRGLHSLREHSLRDLMSWLAVCRVRCTRWGGTGGAGRHLELRHRAVVEPWVVKL